MTASRGATAAPSVKIGAAMSPRKRPSLVEQVRESLLGDLTSGKLAPGAKLANENDLAERFGVSRSTIREAVGGLMDAGYLVRRHGSGTYVTSSPRTRHPLETTVSYTAMIRASGQTPAETVVSRAVRTPAEDERAVLGLTDLAGRLTTGEIAIVAAETSLTGAQVVARRVARVLNLSTAERVR